MEATETALPDDALAAVLARLPARTLAASRCVCEAWRAVVDARGLLRAHVLPHALRGVFVNYIDYPRPGLFFARPSSSPRPGTSAIPPHLGHRNLPASTSSDVAVLDHCNGLLLYGCDARELYVVNPVTRRWERLPPVPGLPADDKYLAYLVFDPAALSMHYEVVLVPRVPEKPGHRYPLVRQAPSSSWREGEDPYRLMEWPPPSWTLQVFSSVAKRWEQRPFAREGKAVGTVQDARRDSFPCMHLGPRRRYAVSWRGAFYVHCQGAFVTRFSLTNDEYQVVATPTGIEEGKSGRSYLGRSENRIYFASFYDYYRLRIWSLDESHGEMKWILRHDIDFESSALWAALQLSRCQRMDGSWVLDDDDTDSDNLNSVALETCFDWDSDDDDVVSYEDKDEYEHAYIYILGFHPYKDVVFLMASYVGVAYHLNSAKVQCLGKLYPKDYDLSCVRGIHEAFPYTPCLVGELPGPDRRNQPEHQQHA